jgi:hypothetical protein
MADQEQTCKKISPHEQIKKNFLKSEKKKTKPKPCCLAWKLKAKKGFEWSRIKGVKILLPFKSWQMDTRITMTIIFALKEI